ncbi:selenite/tellurite reduction operon c-type cytochrome lipoprotein ExtS, partial [Thermodesulfobacteriota bacterium]
MSVVWTLSTVPNSDYNGCLKCHRLHHETLGTCTGCHRGNLGTERVNIAHYRLIQGRYAHFNFPKSPVIQAGHDLIEELACRRCHVSGNSGNQLAADLDRAFLMVQPQDLAAFIKEPAPFMPNFYFTETHIDKLVNAILAAAADAADQTDEIPYMVHFKDSNENSGNLFDKHCGTCHRVLSQQFG